MNDLQDAPPRTDPRPDVNVTALVSPPEIRVEPPMVRRRSVLIGVAITVVLTALAGGGVWWQRTVTGDPGLEFYGGPNVYRDQASTDHSGIERKINMLGDEVDVTFQPNGRLYAHFGLYNGGHHDVRIEGAPTGRYYYWGLDGMSLSTDLDDGFVGVATNYEPFRPFTLHPGDTREVRLDLRLADCDPASLQRGGYSTLRGLTLRYRIFGVSRTRHIPFRDSAIALQAMGECAHPLVEDNQ
jgi:hypothetical protein